MSREPASDRGLGARLRRFGATPCGALAVAFVAWNLAAMDQSLFSYAVPGMMRDFHIGLAVVGTMISASFVFGMLSPPVAGVVTDLWGPRRILALCLGCASLLVFAQAFAPSAFVFGVLRVLSYAFSATLSPITSALVANTAPPRQRALFIAILQSAYPLGGFVAAMAFIPLAGGGNWRAPFSVGLAVVPVAWFLSYLLPERGPARPAAARAARSPVRELFGTRNRPIALLCIAAFFLYGGAIGGSSFYMPTFFQQQRGYPPSVASLIVGLTFAIGAIGYLVAAFVSNTRFGVWRTTVLWSGLGAALFAVSIWLPPAFARDVVLFGFDAMFLFGTASIMTTYLLDVFEGQIRGTAMAICGTAALTAGYIVFPLLTARAVEAWGWLWAFTAVVVTAAFGVCLVFLALPNLPREPVGDARLATFETS
jgi:AAHS family benzoate transporter-like MFS transporter